MSGLVEKPKRYKNKAMKKKKKSKEKGEALRPSDAVRIKTQAACGVSVESGAG